MEKEKDGVWRTIRGRRIFIGKGEDLATAMKNSGKFSNQMSRVKKNKDKYDIIQKAKNFDKELKKTNKERWEIDKSKEKNKWEEQEKYKPRHNTKEAQRYEKNEYKQNDNKLFSSVEFEKNLPHEMRWKETYSVNDGKDLYWVTQEPFTNEMLNKYAEEFKKQGRYEKAYITTRDFSGYDYDDDLKRNTMAVIDKKGNINDNAYEKQMNDAGWEYRKQQSNNKTIENFKAKKQSNNKVDNEYHFAGEELYSDDPHRYDDMIKSSQARKEKFKADTNFKKENHLGWGDYNKDGVPVYDNDIDYTGDFGWANLKSLTNDDLTKALNIQSEEYHKAMNESVGDRRTRNGRMNKIFKDAKVGKYEKGMQKISEEMQKRDMPRYNIYDKKNPNNILVSSPTKEMADRQIQEMYKTDMKLGEHYGWKELPKYDYRVGKVDDYLNEVKDTNKTIKNYVEKKQSNNSVKDDEIVNDDKQAISYSFRTNKRDMFTIRYDRVGNNKNMDFATTASTFNRNRKDYDRAGQAQKDVLKEGTKARAFYDKWDKKHLGTLTQKEYKELVNDIEDLKKEYPYIQGDRFYDQVELDRSTKDKKSKIEAYKKRKGK